MDVDPIAAMVVKSQRGKLNQTFQYKTVKFKTTLSFSLFPANDLVSASQRSGLGYLLLCSFAIYFVVQNVPLQDNYV